MSSLGLFSSLLISLLVGLPAQTASVPALLDLPAGESVTWAGHAVVYGHKKVPVLGKLKTRTETYSLASVRADPNTAGAFVVTEAACDVQIKSIAGMKLAVDGPKLPSSVVRMVPDGARWSGAGSVGWGSQDVDGDGHPGAAISIDSIMCAGALHVSNASRITMKADESSAEGMRGSVFLKVKQRVLETEGRCLAKVAKEETANRAGRFAYARVPAGSTCESLAANAWPVRAK